MEANDTPVEETAPAAEVTESAPVEEGQEVAATEPAAETVETTETPEDYKPKGVQKRIDELTREKYEAKRQLDQERAERQRLQEFLTAQQKPAEQTAPPSLEECGWDDEKHRVEVAKWAAKEQFKAIEAEQRKAQQQAAQQEQQGYFRQVVEEVNTKGAKEFQDYSAVVQQNPNIVVTNSMAAILASVENGHRVAYWLGNNPGESHRIAAMPEVLQAIEIGKLDARLSNVTRKVTSAPPPVAPVSARGSVQKDPDKMSTSEWIEWRNRQISEK